MNAHRNTEPIILIAACFSLLLLCCGPSGPAPPAPGTPAFEWQRASAAFEAGDYVKTNEHLTKVAEAESEYSEQAQAWAMVTSFALANSYLELAEKFDEGALRNRANPQPFRRTSYEYKAKAKSAALQYAELANSFVNSYSEKDVKLVFPLPEVSLEEPAEYGKITLGQLVPDAERAMVEDAVIGRELVHSACRILSEPEDIAGAKAAYQEGEASVSGSTFLLATAENLFEVGEMLGPKKLDQPQRVNLIYELSLRALALVEENGEAEELKDKVTEALDRTSS